MALPSEIDTGSGLVPRGDLTPISEEELFEDALPQIEKTHYATGGTNGIMNIAAWVLGNRTKWLKAKIDALISIGANIASAATTNIGASTGNTLHITGTTTITSFGTATTGARRTLIFDGILTLTHNATTLILPTAANIVTAVGDTAEFVKEADGWRCVDYLRKDGKALASIDFSSQAEVDAGLTGNKAIAPDTLKTHLNSRTKTAITTATQSTTGITLINITELSLSLEANTLYEICAYVRHKSAASTTGINIGWVAQSDAICNITELVSSGSTGAFTEKIFPSGENVYSGNVLGTTSDSVNFLQTSQIFGHIQTTTPCNIQLTFATEISGSAVTIQPDSILIAKGVKDD